LFGISRVLSAKDAWHEVLQCAQNPALNIIISNTTEVGLQLVLESIFSSHRHLSRPSCWRSYMSVLKSLGAGASKLVVLPTELITDNGKILRRIVTELARSIIWKQPLRHGWMKKFRSAVRWWIALCREDPNPACCNNWKSALAIPMRCLR
jgi:mannitol-1-phosphate/altronate dehydrogenase